MAAAGVLTAAAGAAVALFGVAACSAATCVLTGAGVAAAGVLSDVSAAGTTGAGEAAVARNPADAAGAELPAAPATVAGKLDATEPTDAALPITDCAAGSVWLVGAPATLSTPCSMVCRGDAFAASARA